MSWKHAFRKSDINDLGWIFPSFMFILGLVDVLTIIDDLIGVSNVDGVIILVVKDNNDDVLDFTFVIVDVDVVVTFVLVLIMDTAVLFVFVLVSFGISSL